DGAVLHTAPQGGYLMIRFRHADGTLTPEVPQAGMDARNAAVPVAKITARDVTDTHVRGVCKAAAVIFGLAYELWAKMPLESGYGGQQSEPTRIPTGRPTDGVWEAQSEESRVFLLNVAEQVAERVVHDPADALDYLESQGLDTDEKAALWTRLDSKVRTALKKAHDAAAKAKKEAA